MFRYSYFDTFQTWPRWNNEKKELLLGATSAEQNFILHSVVTLAGKVTGFAANSRKLRDEVALADFIANCVHGLKRANIRINLILYNDNI